jgi:hypothetical protein
MANFASAVTLYGQDTFTSSATQMHPLGTRGYTSDGRRFRYAQVGATDTVAGSLYQGAAPVTAHLANTPPVVAIGAKSFVYTPGAAAGAANLYAEGYLQIDTAGSGAPNGYMYQVSGHAAISSSTAFTLFLVDPIQVALATSSRVGLLPNLCKNVIVTPTTSTAAVVGVSPCVIATTAYGWLQTWGPAACLINGTPAITSPVVNSATTAGAVDVWTTAAAAVVVTPVGSMMQVGVSGKNNAVFLKID